MEPHFANYAQADPELPAIIDVHGAAWTRGRLRELCNRLAHALIGAGLTGGEAVAVISPNCPEYLAVLLATAQAGLSFVPVNWRLPQTEVEHVIRDSRAKVIVIHQRLARFARPELIAGCDPAPMLLSIGAISGLTDLLDLTSRYPNEDIQCERPGFVMPYTSATTGRPKGIVRAVPDQRVALSRGIDVHIRMGSVPGPGGVHLCASMLYHSAPLEFARVALHMGHTVVLMDHWEPESLLRQICAHRVTSSFMVPAMFIRLLKLPLDVRQRYATTSLKWVNHAGSFCPVEVKRQMIEWWGPILWEGYGASEGNGTVLSAQEWLSNPGSVGRPLPGSRFKILDEEGRELPNGQIGLIYFTHFNGGTFEYKGDPEKTRRAHRGEFFTVGDIGYVNPAGYVFLCDRKDDLVISNGHHIYPAEIEQTLVMHPEVADCAVFGVEDAVLGESLRAVVQPLAFERAGAELTRQLLRFLLERLSAAKLPRRIDYLPELPRDPNGKLYKRLLHNADAAASQ